MLSATVVGTPVSQGSKRFLGNGRMVEANHDRLRPWRADVRQAALSVAPDVPMRGPVAVRLWFTFARPASHYGTGRNAATLRPSAPRLVAVRPDLDKITRAVLDSLTEAGWWHDDSQVAVLEVRKGYASPGDRPGVQAQAWEVEQ